MSRHGAAVSKVCHQYEYVIADVFTNVPFGGNPLAVFPDASGLSAKVMQTIAREFNFAESTFVVPATREDCSAQIRIFTPRREIPFAGHPTIGTAAVMSFLKRAAPDLSTGLVTYQERIGPVTVRVAPAKGQTVVGELILENTVEYPDTPPDPRVVARCLGLAECDILETWFAGIGIPFCFVHLRGAGSVDAAVLDRPAWNATLAQTWAPQLFIFAGELNSGSTLHARMFAPALGVEEDPATGSACVALVATLAERAAAHDGVFSISVNQGVAMGRPSSLNGFADRLGGKTRHLRLGGASVIVAEGRMRV